MQKKAEKTKNGGMSNAKRAKLIRECEDRIQQNSTYRFFADLLEKQRAIDDVRTNTMTTEEMFEVYLQTAQGEDSDAMFAVASMYRNGDGAPKDPQKSLEWIKKAAQAGDSDAMMFLAKKHDCKKMTKIMLKQRSGITGRRKWGVLMPCIALVG